MQITQPFRKCHLQILRSLYDGQGGIIGEESNHNAEADGTDGVAADNDNDSKEAPVVNDIWDLIERFLERRMEYRPHKERQIHWANVNAEAQSRLDHLLSIASVEEEKKLFPPQQRLSLLTPRTPLFSVSGRGASMTPSMSLTPQSSNRNAPKLLSQNDRELASTIPSWNFLSQMLQRRSRICTQSCQSFRSQPFLAQLREEAEMRCKILEKVLKRLKTGTRKHKTLNDKKKGEGLALSNPVGKRQKLGMDGTQTKIPSSLGHFFFNRCSEDSATNDLDDESVCDEDSIMETQIKLCLWSSLLSSVKEIVDEHEE